MQTYQFIICRSRIEHTLESRDTDTIDFYGQPNLQTSSLCSVWFQLCIFSFRC